MAQKLQQKKRKNHDPLDQVIVETNNASDIENISHDDSRIGSPRRDSPIKSILEETGNPSVTKNVSNTDTNTNLNE